MLDRLTADEALVDHFVYLVGRPPIKDFTGFVTEQGVNGQDADVGALTEEWHAASRYIRELQSREKGCPADAVTEPLPGHLEPLRDRLFEDPVFRHAFNTVPTDVGIVELDRLVVYQKFVNLSHRELFRRGLGADYGDADIFRACLPFAHPQPPVRWVRTHHDEFVFPVERHQVPGIGGPRARSDRQLPAFGLGRRCRGPHGGLRLELPQRHPLRGSPDPLERYPPRLLPAGNRLHPLAVHHPARVHSRGARCRCLRRSETEPGAVPAAGTAADVQGLLRPPAPPDRAGAPPPSAGPGEVRNRRERRPWAVACRDAASP